MILRGKSAVITGGTGGIAIATARQLLKCGIDKIALIDIEYYEEMLTILREDFPKQEVMFHLADVTKKDELERAFQEVDYKFHYIDIVITCAGIVDEPEYELMIDINLLGVMHANYMAIPHMSRENGRRGGLIVNISSVAGIDCTQFSSPGYNASKHAIVAFTRSMGSDFYYDKYGIKFITVCPGITFTQLLDDLEDKLYSPEAYEATQQLLQPMPRQTVEEFAIAFIDVLDTEKNGSVWMIDGGKPKEIECQNHWVESVKNV